MSGNAAAGQVSPRVRHVRFETWYARQVSLPGLNAPGMVRLRIKPGKRLPKKPLPQSPEPRGGKAGQPSHESEAPDISVSDSGR